MSLIVADIGGTNARLAFQKDKNSEIDLIDNFLCSNFKSLEDIINTYKKKYNILINNMSIAVAGPCENDEVKLMNNHITFNKKDLFKKIHDIRKNFTNINLESDFDSQLSLLASLKKEVESFFDNVIVNDNDIVIKKNRLELLKMLCNTFDKYFNFEKIELLNEKTGI